MHHTPQSLKAELTKLNIPFKVHTHKAHFTVQESQADIAHLPPGAHIKNLFLKDKSGALFLITATHESKFALNKLGKFLKVKDRLSFAPPELLLTTLGVLPGSVTPLGLINAAPGSVRVFLDEQIFAHSIVYPHPLVNTETLELSPTSLTQALAHWGHSFEKIDLSQFPQSVA